MSTIATMMLVLSIVAYSAVREYFVSMRLLSKFPNLTFRELFEISEPFPDPFFLPFARDVGRQLAWKRHRKIAPEPTET
jgi:hypothetical protein